jgi:hypothetical protein
LFAAEICRRLGARIIDPRQLLGVLGLRRADRGLRAPVRPHGGLGPRDTSRVSEIDAIAPR